MVLELLELHPLGVLQQLQIIRNNGKSYFLQKNTDKDYNFNIYN